MARPGFSPRRAMWRRLLPPLKGFWPVTTKEPSWPQKPDVSSSKNVPSVVQRRVGRTSYEDSGVMTSDPIWQPLVEELARWQRAGRKAELWLRDDDAVDPTPALDRLLDLTGEFAVPVTLAVIPALTDEKLVAGLTRRRMPRSPSMAGRTEIMRPRTRRSRSSARIGHARRCSMIWLAGCRT